jgi:hypothetical protein
MKLFQLTTAVLAAIQHFTGRTENHGGEDVPAVSVGFRISGPNTLLDLLSDSAKATIYLDNQKRLDDVAPVLTELRCADITEFNLANIKLEGWTLVIVHATAEPYRLGKCKVHKFKVTKALQGGSIELDFLVSTADCSEEVAGWLWARNGKSIEIMLLAPEQPEEEKKSPKKAKGKAPVDDGRQQNLDATGAFVDAHAPKGDTTH